MRVGQKAIAIIVVYDKRPQLVETILIIAIFTNNIAQVFGSLLMIETQHLREVRLQGKNFGDIIAARQVIHRNRQHTRTKASTDTSLADTRLDSLEEGTQEALASGDRLVKRVLIGREQLVGEIIVLIDQDIYFWKAMLAGVPQSLLQHLGGIAFGGKLEVLE